MVFLCVFVCVCLCVCVCVSGRKLSAELLLGLSLQRGSLRYLLEWVHMALTAATTAADDSSDG